MESHAPATPESAGTQREPTEPAGDRRAFMEQAARVGAGAMGLGALLSLAGEAGAQDSTSAAPSRTPAGIEMHNRPLDQETMMCIQQVGMELIAYTYGVEARNESARGFLSIFGCGRTKNGTTCTTCCHPDRARTRR